MFILPFFSFLFFFSFTLFFIFYFFIFLILKSLILTCVPKHEPPSHLPPHNISLGHPHAPAPSMLYPASDIDWRFNSYMIVYMLECHSPKSSHPLPLSPKVRYTHLCLFSCLAYRVVIAIFLKCGEKGTLLHCWWECKLVQPLWRTVWRFLKRLKIELPMTKQSH